MTSCAPTSAATVKPKHLGAGLAGARDAEALCCSAWSGTTSLLSLWSPGAEQTALTAGPGLTTGVRWCGVIARSGWARSTDNDVDVQSRAVAGSLLIRQPP